MRSVRGAWGRCLEGVIGLEILRRDQDQVSQEWEGKAAEL